MKQEELLKSFEKEFEKLKKELGFKATLKELDEIFFLKDLIMQLKFISPTISRTICSRIVETLNSWNGYLHSLIMPNPQNMANLTESDQFDEQEKKEIIKIMNKSFELTSRNTLIGLKKDKNQEAKFIDDSVEFWKSKFKIKIQEIMEKINNYWKEKAKE